MVKDRSGNEIPSSGVPTGLLSFLYRNPLGRILLRLLCAKWVSVLVGAYMDSTLSKGCAKKALREHAVDMTGVTQTEFDSYNALFTRTRDTSLFPFSSDPCDFCSPADSKLTVLPIKDGTVMHIKQAPYTAKELLQEETDRFDGGYAFVFRLSVEDYHRYAYPDSGRLIRRHLIKGTFHTVNPIALEALPVFHRNCREVSVLETEHFGTVAYVEVGAMLVGRICNHKKSTFVRGEEKGYFAYGGSTVVLLTEQGAVTPDADLLENSRQGIETYVRTGETVGKKCL